MSIVTIFPDLIRSVFDYGVIGRAIKRGIVTIDPVDLRAFTKDKHRTVDGRPYGGGPGMILRVDVIDRALSAIKETRDKRQETSNTSRIVLLSPQGRVFDQEIAREYAKLDHLILISGRYEGVDERVKQHLVDEELSIGNYVLSGGEIPAMVVADAVARLIPGVLGDPESLTQESFSSESLSSRSSTLGPFYDFPQYTEPAEYRRWAVPDVLRSGNHQEIDTWRATQATRRSENHPLLDASSSQEPC